MHNQRSGLQHAAPRHTTQTFWSKQKMEKQRGKERCSGSKGKVENHLCWWGLPRTLMLPRIPGSHHHPHQGQNALWWSLKPQQHLYAACLLACTCARERERECTPSCNVGINIHGPVVRVGAMSRSWDMAEWLCKQTKGVCVCVSWLHKEKVTYNSSSTKVTGYSLMPSAYIIITVVQRLLCK